MNTKPDAVNHRERFITMLRTSFHSFLNNLRPSGKYRHHLLQHYRTPNFVHTV